MALSSKLKKSEIISKQILKRVNKAEEILNIIAEEIFKLNAE